MRDPYRPESPDEEILGAERSAVKTELTEPQRIERISRELERGFEALSGVCGVSCFGSARVAETDPRYAQARTTGRLLARAGFTVITGGGPGLMEAAVLRTERRDELLAALERLSDDDRAVLGCRHLLGLGEEETAAALGIRRGTVKSRTSRALVRLRAELGEAP